MTDETTTDDTTADDTATLAALHAKLEADAAAADLLDVAYRELDSPLGRLLVAATPLGVVRLAFHIEGLDAVLASLGARVSPRILRSPARLDTAARELDDYFAGRRTAFDLPLDLRLTSGFRRRVVEHLPSIPYGRTESYARVADAVGSPRAVRAAGSACATNPLPILVPCHRVLRADGAIGNYLGGTAAKVALLELEGAR